MPATASPFKSVWPLCTALFFAALPRPACAEPKVGDAFGDWVFECAAIAEDKTNCALTQTIINSTANQRIAKFSITRGEKKGSVLLTALVPLGIHLPSGVNGTIDDGKPFQYELVTCLQQGCIATYAMDAAAAKIFQNGQKLGLSFTTNAGRKSVHLTGSLKGTAGGMKAANFN